VTDHKLLDDSMQDVSSWLQKHRTQLKVDASGNLSHIQSHRLKLQVIRLNLQ